MKYMMYINHHLSLICISEYILFLNTLYLYSIFMCLSCVLEMFDPKRFALFKANALTSVSRDAVCRRKRPNKLVLKRHDLWPKIW